MTPRPDRNAPSGMPGDAILPEDALRAAMEQCERQIRSGRVGTGLAAIEQCWRRIEHRDTPALHAECQRILALGLQYKGELRESLLASLRARELYQRLGDAAGEARTLSIAAISLGRIGDAVQALALIQEAHRLTQPRDDADTEFRVWINMSVVHETLADYPKAIAAAETAIALGERMNADVAMKLHARTKLCIYRVKHALERKSAGAFDEATAMLTPLADEIATHSQACRSAGLDHLVTASLSAAGSAHLALGQPDQARSVLEQGLTLAMAKGLERDQTRLLLTLAEAEQAAGEGGTSAQRLLTALKLAQQLGEPELVVQAHLLLSRACEARGDAAGALAHFRRYHEALVGTLRHSADTRAQVLAIQLDSERARIDAEVARLRAAELERDKRNLMSQAEQLSRHANEDALTGLGNRRYFNERLAQLRAGAEPVVLALADLDHFKQVNDRHSHAVGDQVLRQVAALFREHCRPRDAVARFGGEEFVIALVGISTAIAQRIADRLRQRIADHDWGSLQPGLAVTISIGLADCAPGGDPEQALARADTALYAAKHGGRNQVQVAE